MALVQAAQGAVAAATGARSYVDGLANKFIVKPRASQGIGGFVFSYEGSTDLRIRADITDHFLENNVAAQDHIAIEPIRLVFRGFVAELVLQKPTGLLGAIQSIQNRLTQLPGYLGRYTPGSITKIQAALTKTQQTVQRIDQTIAKAKNIVGFFDKTAPGRTAQEKAYGKLQSLMVSRQLMVVVTPWGTFNQMVIEDLLLTQDDKTKLWTDITVHVKRMNFVDVQTDQAGNRGGRNAAQSAPTVNKGRTGGTPVGAPSAASGLYKVFGSAN